MLRTAVFVLSLLTLSSAFGRPEAPPAPGFVRLVVAHDGGQSRSAQGCVIRGGYVLTTIDALEGATSVRVLQGDAACNSAGVVAYNSLARVALLTVDWGSAAPPEASIAAKTLPLGTEVALCCPQLKTATSPARVLRVEQALFFQIKAAPIPTDVGGVMVLHGNELAGYVQGSDFGVRLTLTMPFVPEENLSYLRPEVLDALMGSSHLSVVRPEVLGALKATVTIPWDEWKGRQKLSRDADALAEKAAEELWKGDSESAAADGRAAVTLDDRCWYGWSVLCSALAKNAAVAEAIAAADRATELVPTDAFALSTKANLLAKAHRAGEAIPLAQRAVESQPLWSIPHASLGYALRLDGRLTEAAAEYREALRLDPTDERTRSVLAELEDAPVRSNK